MLSDLRSTNQSNSKFCYLNIISVRNKLTDFQEMVNGNVDVLSIAKTKIDAFFLLLSLYLKGIIGHVV